MQKEQCAWLLLSSAVLRAFSEKMGAELLSWRHTGMSFSFFRAAVCSIVQRRKSRGNTYALRGKNHGKQKKEERTIHSLQRIVTDYRTRVCSSVFAEPCEKYYKVGCVSRVASELNPVLLERSVWWAWQELGVHPEMHYEDECSGLCSGTRL